MNLPYTIWEFLVCICGEQPLGLRYDVVRSSQASAGGLLKALFACDQGALVVVHSA